MNLVYLDKLGLTLTNVFFLVILLKYGEENAKFFCFRDGKFLIKLTT